MDHPMPIFTRNCPSCSGYGSPCGPCKGEGSIYEELKIPELIKVLGPEFKGVIDKLHRDIITEG